MPKLRFNASATYDEGPYSFTVRTRVTGSAVISNLYVEGVDIDKNGIPPVAYLDLRGSYQWNDNLQFYLAIDNTLNTPPPEEGGGQVFDRLGRAFRLGIRFND